MPAEIITIASLKGAAGKTTTAYALAAAAAAGGLRVIVLDLDPSGALTNALALGARTLSVADVLFNGSALGAVLSDHPLGIRVAVADRALTDQTVFADQLEAILAPVRSTCDVVLLDTDPRDVALPGPIAVADRIVIPTGLDILSLRSAALTVGLAHQVGVLDRVGGLAVSDVDRVMSRTEESLLHGLHTSGLAFDTVLWSSPAWASVTSGTGELPSQELLLQSKMLLREVATRSVAVDALRYFIGVAQGRREPAAVGG